MNHQETEARSIKVIGHLHPDTDSICSAIAYSRLKGKLNPSCTYQPCRAGELNRETRFVLDYFHAEAPALFTDVSPRIEDVDYRRAAGVDGETSLRQAWALMRDQQLDTLCVVDGDERLTGVVTTRDMTKANMDLIDDLVLAKAKTSYKNLIETLDATVLTGDIEGKVVEGRIHTGAGSAEVLERTISQGDVVIVSNRSESQLAAIEMHAGCIVVCIGAKVSRTIQMLADEQGCIIISTPYSTYVTGQMIVQAAPVRHYMVTEGLLTFTPQTLVESASRIMASVRYRYFPILDGSGRYLGMVSRRNLLNLKKRQMILVDHNEKSQAVEGLDEAEVLEIIDHHRLNPSETDGPVYFRNEPVGCTSTIIWNLYRENGVEIEPETAGLMLSAILSDTLMFRSPTCTPTDERAARALAELAGVELEQYAEEMFEAGGDITGKTPEELLSTDYKIFGKGEVHFGVAQISSITQKSRLAGETLVAPYLPGFREKQGLDYVFCMFTDVTSSNTELLAAGDGAGELIHRAFGVQPEDGKAVLKGIVSRKKQLVPALLDAIKQAQASDMGY